MFDNYLLKSKLAYDTHIRLPFRKGEYVLYSPNGTAQPFVISDTALEIYELFLQGKTVEDIVEWKDSAIISKDSLRAIILYFFDEGLLTLKPGSKSSFSQRPRQKSIGLWIHTTDTCNLNCDYCYINKGKSFISTEMCHEIVKALLLDIHLVVCQT